MVYYACKRGIVMYDKQYLTTFPQMFFHRDDVPIVCDYSDLLNQYSNLLTRFLNNKSGNYHDFFYLDLVVSGFEYYLDLFFSKPEAIDYLEYGVEMLQQFNILKARGKEFFSSDEGILIMSLTCAHKVLDSSYSDKDLIVAKILNNCYRVSLVNEDVNDVRKRRM